MTQHKATTTTATLFYLHCAEILPLWEHTCMCQAEMYFLGVLYADHILCFITSHMLTWQHYILCINVFCNHLNRHLTRRKITYLKNKWFHPSFREILQGLKIGIVLFTSFWVQTTDRIWAPQLASIPQHKMKGLGFRTSSCATCLNKCCLQVKK